MRQKHTHRLAAAQSHSTRLAWWAAFLATVALIGILNFVRSADAATLPAAAGGTAAALGDFELEDGENGEEEAEFEEVEECEGEEEEVEECLEEVAAERAPEECGLIRTDAKVTLSPHGRMHLTVRYSARSSTLVAVDYRLRGTKGALKMDSDRSRFTGTGTFHEAERLTPGQTARAMAARSFTVELHPLGSPRYCQTYFEERLDVRRSTPQGPVWLSRETTFRVPAHR